MAYLGQTYTTADLPQGRSFEPIPAGWYQAKITEADLKPTKDGTGQYIKLRYDILGPSHQGRVIYGNINLRNANPKAEEIGRQNLGDIARALGLAAVDDTDQLVGGDLQVKIAIKPAQEGYEPSNEVKAFKAIEGAGQTFAQSFSTPDLAGGFTAGSAPPWMKR
jgi:hypothetical protein